MKRFSKPFALAAALLALAVLLPHFLFPQTEWVYDDRAILELNRVVHERDFHTIWTTPYWSGVDSVYQKDNLHRPLFLTLAAILTDSPNWLRLFVALSHLAAGLLVGWAAFSIARRWRGVALATARWIGGGAAAFFLVQPALVEVTAQGIGLMETIPFLCGFGALLLAPRRPAWAIALAAFGPGWKETGYVWLALLAGAFAWRRQWRALTATCAVAAGWLGLRFFVYGSLFESRLLPFSLLNPLVEMSFTDAWLTRVSLLGHYLRLIFLPWDLSCDYSVGTLPVPGYLLEVWFLAGAAFLGWLIYRRKEVFTRDHLPYWGGLLTVLPVLHLASPAGVIFAERFGYAFAAAVILCTLQWVGPAVVAAAPRKRQLVLGALAVLTLADYGRMALRHRDWVDGETLFSTDSRNYPFNAKLHFNYAVALGQQRRWENAREELLQAVNLQPDFPDAHYRLSLVYRALGDKQNAKIHHDVAVRLGNTPAEREPAGQD